MLKKENSGFEFATREQKLRFFESEGMLRVETLPVIGSAFKNLDQARLDNYLKDIIHDPEIPKTETEWIERLQGLGLMTKDAMGTVVCSVAGLLCFGINPRRFLPQSGLRVMVFQGNDKDYQALLDVVLDAPLVGRWQKNEIGQKECIEDGLIEKFASAIKPFITQEASEIDEYMRREKTEYYPWEAIRETVINALAHRDWTRSVDIEVTSYGDRLEVVSPGKLHNSMTISKILAGQRSPRNTLIVEILRDYGYVDSRGMGVRTKVVPLMKRFNQAEPIFESTEDYFKTTLLRKKLVI